MPFRHSLWTRGQRERHFETAGVREVRLLEPPVALWDRPCPGLFTLSYIRFLYSPDVFPKEFVIIYSWGHGFRGDER
jgi:hypothetical protein